MPSIPADPDDRRRAGRQQPVRGRPADLDKGDADTAIAGRRAVVEGTMELGGQEHFYLEGQAALALPQEGGDMLVHSSTQHPTEIQHKVAEALGKPMHAVRVEIAAHGRRLWRQGKPGQCAGGSLCGGATMTGKPCKMRYDRDDDMTITGKRHDFRIDYRCRL